jgi:hypothetical protein
MTAFFLRVSERMGNGVLMLGAILDQAHKVLRGVIGDRRIEQRTRSAQNEIDILAGHWASDLSSVISGAISGSVNHFTVDLRPVFAMNTLGGDPAGRNLRILELGPLEAGRSYSAAFCRTPRSSGGCRTALLGCTLWLRRACSQSKT